MTTPPQPHPLLGDGIGSVELLDVFGDDLTVVNAARVSFAKESTQIEPRDAKLIQYLADHQHITPFFHPQARFRLKMPIFVAREWYRHQIGFARNEVSRRYVDFEPEVYAPTELRARDPKLKQGSKAECIVNNALHAAEMEKALTASVEAYNALLEADVAPEVARMVLPQSMYTEFIETGSLAAYARLCHLRQDPHAQWEIRQYADAVAGLLESRFPVSWRALFPPPKPENGSAPA
jgi:thymidylate synthase (FAD)